MTTDLSSQCDPRTRVAVGPRPPELHLAPVALQHNGIVMYGEDVDVAHIAVAGRVDEHGIRPSYQAILVRSSRTNSAAW